MEIIQILEGVVNLKERQQGRGFVVRTAQGEFFIEAPVSVVGQLVDVYLKEDFQDEEELQQGEVELAEEEFSVVRQDSPTLSVTSETTPVSPPRSVSMYVDKELGVESL